MTGAAPWWRVEREGALGWVVRCDDWKLERRIRSQEEAEEVLRREREKDESAFGGRMLELEDLVHQVLHLVDSGVVSASSLQAWAHQARGRYVAIQFPRSVCAAPKCQMPIVWGISREGRRVPLDPRPPVYAVIEGGQPAAVLVARARMGLVSHWTTCKDPEHFKGKGN